MRLNLGACDDIRPGWCNVDRVKLPGVEVVMDLAEPWQFADSTVDEIYAADIFEHIGDCLHIGAQICDRCYRPRRGGASGCQICGMMPCYEGNMYCKIRHWSGRVHTMNEAHRVLKPGGILRMECPDAAQGCGQWQDPTHVSAWTPNGLQYFEDGSPAHRRFAAAYGITARFKILILKERNYFDLAGGPGGLRCEVWKFAAVLEAVK